MRGEWAAFNGPRTPPDTVVSGARWSRRDRLTLRDRLPRSTRRVARASDPRRTRAITPMAPSSSPSPTGCRRNEGWYSGERPARTHAVPITLRRSAKLRCDRGRQAAPYATTTGLAAREGRRPCQRGQVVALLGNSGNSTEPHVHFQIADGPTFLSSKGCHTRRSTSDDAVSTTVRRGDCAVVAPRSP